MHYLCQPDVLLLYGVLQAVAEGSGQQQICGLADHVVHLRGAAEGEEQQQQQLSVSARTNSLSPFLSLRIPPFGKSLNVSQQHKHNEASDSLKAEQRFKSPI